MYSPDTPPPDGTAPEPRPLRADARRNRERLIEAARARLARGRGPLSLEGVARDAGVGIGTLYRHFPTRDALVGALYAAELDELAASAAALLRELPPERALRAWVLRYARFAAAKRGMADTLRAAMAAGTIESSATWARISAAVGPLLEAGAREGSLRADVDADDVTAMLLGVSLATAREEGVERTGRLLDLVLDALRP
ncbi:MULTISPECIES: TetR/AcrR family transcriptional regulator [unclassified Nocardiopsis]|uniref:TetR/AcrR family transcriptional regulator n=1 Tax=Nocardiopsis TaxID=2013 RepID=UPI00387AEA03